MNRIILPLDNKPWKEAKEIIEMTSGLVWGYKLRRTILENGIGSINQTKKYGNVMVDFKLYDIPSAMDEAVRLFADAGADIITVHCTSGWKPMQHSKIAGVTILTSMDYHQFRRYYKGHYKFQSVGPMVELMAHDADSYGYGYIVCSPQEVELLKHISCKKICPGIRPEWYSREDDQKRTATPRQAIEDGADLLVIGRPILNDNNMIEAIQKTNKEIINERIVEKT